MTLHVGRGDMENANERREQNRLWQRQHRQCLDSQTSAQQRERNRHAENRRIQNMTAEQNSERLERNRLSQQRRRLRNQTQHTATELPSHANQRRQSQREWARQRRASLSNEQ